MRYLKLVSVFFALALVGCGRPAENSQTSTTQTTTKIEPANTNAGTSGATECPSQFYYYNQEKISLKMKPHFLIVGFQPGTSVTTKTGILKQFPEYETSSQDQTTDAVPFQVVKLRSGTTCAQAMPILEKLKAARPLRPQSLSDLPQEMSRSRSQGPSMRQSRSREADRCVRQSSAAGAAPA